MTSALLKASEITMIQPSLSQHFEQFTRVISPGTV